MSRVRHRNVRVLLILIVALMSWMVSSTQPTSGSTQGQTAPTTAAVPSVASGTSKAPLSSRQGSRKADATAYKTAILRDNPSAYYRLDETGGPTAADSSGHGVTGTYAAGVEYKVPGILQGDTAVSSSESVLTAAGLTFPKGTTGVTMEVWYAGSANPNRGNNYISVGSLNLWSNDNGLDVGDGTRAYQLNRGDLWDGSWHLLDVVDDGTNGSVYMDGQLIWQGPMAFPSGTDVQVGGTAGEYDEAAVYPRALTTAEILKHWLYGASSNQQVCPSGAPTAYGSVVKGDKPSAFYPLGDFGSATARNVAYDWSGNQDGSGNCQDGVYPSDQSSESQTGGIVGDSTKSVVTNGVVLTQSGSLLPQGNHARTIEVWYAGDANPNRGASYLSLGSLDLWSGDNGLDVGDGSRSYQLSRGDLWDGSWHLLDVTDDGNTAVVYLDGQEIWSGTLSAMTGSGLQVGGTAGQYQDAAVYPKALGPDQILAHWVAGASTTHKECQTTPTSPYAQAILADKPAAYYRLDDVGSAGAPTIAYDSSGHCNDAVYPSGQSTTATGGAIVGDRDGAVTTNGTVLSQTGNDLPQGNQARTLEFWYAGSGNPNRGGTYMSLGSFDLWSGDNGLDIGDGTRSYQLSPGNLWDGSWHLVDATDDGSTATVYIDGQQVWQGTLSSMSGGGLQLGGTGGQYDEAVVYPAALSSSQILTHWYAQYLTGPNMSLLGGTVVAGSGSNANPVPGALVQVCNTTTNACQLASSPTDHLGRFHVAVLNGSYSLTAFPPAGSGNSVPPVTDGPFTIPPSNLQIQLSFQSNPIESGGGCINSQCSGNASIFWGSPSTYTVSGCKGGFGVLDVTAPNTSTGQIEKRGFPLTEAPPGSGNYVADIGPLAPLHGNATVTHTISCFGLSTILPSGGSPNGGTGVLLKGSGLTGTSAVDFGSKAAVSFAVVKDNLIEATSPAGTGTVGVTAKTPSGTEKLGDFSYFGVTGVTPQYGASAGGSTVRIFGANFSNVTGVVFGLLPAVSYTVVSSSEIDAVAPEGVGRVKIQVVEGAAASDADAASGYLYQGGPSCGGSIVEPAGPAAFTGLADQLSRCHGQPFQGGVDLTRLLGAADLIQKEFEGPAPGPETLVDQSIQSILGIAVTSREGTAERAVHVTSRRGRHSATRRAPRFNRAFTTLSHSNRRLSGTPPGVPRNVATTPFNGGVHVTWQPPASSGSSPIKGYVVTANPYYNDRLPNPGALPVAESVKAPAQSDDLGGLLEDCHQMYTVSVQAENDAGAGQSGDAPAPFRPSGIVTPGQDPPYVVILIDGIGESQPGFRMDPDKPTLDGQPSYCPESWNSSAKAEKEADFAGPPNGPWSFFHKWNFGEVNNPSSGISNGQAVSPCFAQAGQDACLFDASTPRALPGNSYGLNSSCVKSGNGETCDWTHSFMLDAIAAQGSVILPFSYKGATLSQPTGSSDPMFNYTGYAQCDSANEGPFTGGCANSFDRWVASLDNEVKSVGQVWPDSNVVVMGHSQGGLIAWEWFCSVAVSNTCPTAGGSHPYQAQLPGNLVAAFSLDSPINGVCAIPLGGVISNGCGGPLEYPDYRCNSHIFPDCVNGDRTDLDHPLLQGDENSPLGPSTFHFIGTYGDSPNVKLGVGSVNQFVPAYGSGAETLEHQLLFDYCSPGLFSSTCDGRPKLEPSDVESECANKSNESSCPVVSPPDHISECPVPETDSNPLWEDGRYGDAHFIVKFCPGNVAYFNNTLGLDYPVTAPTPPVPCDLSCILGPPVTGAGGGGGGANGVWQVLALGLLNGSSGLFNMWIDPSGTVVDQNANPIAKATATILGQSSNGAAFKPVDPASGTISPPVNPEITGSDGSFDWMATAGTYKVQATATGCHAAGDATAPAGATPPFQLPPPAVGLVIRLDCAHAPPAPRPTISSVSPNTGPIQGGTEVEIVGANLAGVAGVSFGAVTSPSITVISDDAVEASAPAGVASTVNVTVRTKTNTSSISALDRFTYVKPVTVPGAPVITLVTPSSGAISGGTTFTIAGKNLTGVNAVYLGGNPSPQITDVSSSEVTAVAPASLVLGRVWVTAAGAAGSSVPGGASAFTYTKATPGLTVTAGSQSVVFEHKAAKITPTYFGFTGNDTAASALKGHPKCGTKYDTDGDDPAGTYATTCAEGTLKAIGGKYTFVFVPGTLTVMLAHPSIKNKSPSRFHTGARAGFSSELLSDQKKPVKGRALTFTLSQRSRVQSCTAKATSARGVASCAVGRVTLKKGAATLSITFSGDPQGPKYDYTSATKTVKVTIIS